MKRLNKYKKNLWVAGRARHVACDSLLRRHGDSAARLHDGRFRTHPKCYAYRTRPGSLHVWVKSSGGLPPWEKFVPTLRALRTPPRELSRVVFNY